MRIINYSLGNRYDKFGKIESAQIILARPGKRALGVLNGVREDTCNLEMNLNNTWVLSFNVDRVVNGNISNYYDRIEQKMELHLPGYGWFKITEEPVMSNDGNTESLSIHAESLEIEFQQYILKGFECNTGTTASLEYLAADNVFYYDNDKSYPFFRENVRFYRDTTDWEEMIDAFDQTDKSEQALLSLIAQYPCIMDSWRINYDLSDFDHAIDTVVALGEQASRNMNVLKSYSGQFAKFTMEGLDQQAQQTAFSLTRIWPELLNYITVVGIDYKCYDETHDGDYTLEEVLNLELQRQKDLSLLDIVANHYGWHIGFVDDSVVADSDVDDDRMPLSQKTGMFEVDSQNAYTFMTQEMASYFRCVFVFDTYEKTVNAYNINNLGVDTNIFLSFHNIQNSVERSGNDTIHTAFYIQGGDDLDPLEANFGEDEIWDLSYYMNNQHFSQSTIDKYNAWLNYRESQRQLYMDNSVAYRKQLEVVNELYDRVPIDSADASQYRTMSDDELIQEKEKQLALLRGIESRYVNDNNEFDIEKLQENDPEIYQEYLIIRDSLLSNPTDALKYLEYDSENDEYVFVRDGVDTSDYRLGNIDICIFNRMLLDGSFIDVGDDADTIKAKTNYKKQKEYLDDYLFDFDVYGDVYGVAELQNHLQDLENRYTTLWNKGYGIDNEEDPYHHSQYELYLKYKDSYDKCKAVLDVRQQEYDDASDILNNISQQMLDIKTDVAIENERFGFTDEELELIKKYLYYTDYTNENIIITSISTPEEIVETEYQLIKDAQEELYAAAHPQWIWTTSQDNLFLIAENDDWYSTLPHPSYKDWCEDLVIGNFLHVGFREDDHLPDYVYVDSSSNQVKLRLISVGLNPFMIEPTIDLTFSTMIQYKSRRNDFVDLLGLASGVGDHQITATFQSKKLDDSFQIDSSFVMKLLNNGAFANYAAGSIMNAGTLDSLVVPTIHAAEINVGQITGTTGQFQEMFVNYLDADTIATRIISADNANFRNLIAGTINATTGGIIQLSSTNATIDAGYVTNLVAGRLSVADLQAHNATADQIVLISSSGDPAIAFKNATQQFFDEDGNVRVQIGQDGNGDFNFVIRDADGQTALFDVNGITRNGIPNNTIINNMVDSHTLSKDKMNFNVMEAGDDIIIEQLTYTDGTKFGNEYTTFEQDIANAVAEFVDVIPSVELTGIQTFTIDEDSNILPSKITIYANPRNGFVPYTWTIDGVDASQYVASDGLSIDVPNTAMTNVTSVVVRCQNEDGSSYDAITLSKLPSYNSSITTVLIDNNPVQFFTSASGVPLFRQTATSKITVYKGAEQFYNFSINNLVAPTGVTATVSSNSIEITVSPTAAIGSTDTITFDVVINGGTTISKSITINRLVSTNSESTVVEYTLQTSNLECDENAVWSEIRPTASAEQFLWYRYRTDYSNGDTSKYSKPYYVSTITGLISMTDAINKSITNKIWQDDFSSYDEQVIRHRESEIVQTVDSISTTVSETSSNLGTLATNYQQTANEFHWLFTNSAQTGQPTSMSLTNNGLSLINGNIIVTDPSGNNTIISGGEIQTGHIVGTNGWIDLGAGTFNYGEGALSWDGNTLTIGGIDKTAIISALAEGALQIRYTDSGNISTDENEPLENDEEEQLEGVGYTTLYFDNGYDDNDPMRSAKPWVNFHGHRIEVNPFEIELSDIIIPSVTQFVVYRFGNNVDYQYTVWYDTEHSVWKAINVDYQTELQDWEPANYKQVISWEWNTDEDIIVAEFTKELDGDVNYESYYPSKTYQSIQQAAMLQSWGINGALTETTTINGGSITTGTIDSQAIKTEGIQSRDYSQTPITDTYTLQDSYVFTPVAYEEYIMLEQNSNTSFTITPEEDGEVTVILRYTGDVNGYTFYYSTDYQGNDLSIGGGYASSGEDIEIIFEEPQNNGQYVFNDSTDSIVFYITFPYAQQVVSFNFTAYLSNGATQISFADFINSSITCNGYSIGETYKIYTSAETADNNVITFTFNGDTNEKTLHFLAQDINPNNVVSAELKCYFDNNSFNRVELTSDTVEYLSYDYIIPNNSNTITQMILTLTIDNLNSNQQYVIESYVADGFEHELWDSIIYNDEQLDNVVETVIVDPIYSDYGTWFNLEESGFIRSKNFSIDANGNANFRGTLNATAGEIGGWSIDNNILYYETKYPTSSSMIFSPNGVVSTNSVGESYYQQTWLLTVHDKFGITVNGDLYASGNFQFGGPNGIRYDANTGDITFGSKCVISWDSIDDAGTVITSDSLQTVDIICQNLKVKSANIDVSQGKITAAQLDVQNITVAGATNATYVSASGIRAGNISGCTFTQTDTHGNAQFTSVDGTTAWASINSTTSLANGVVTTGAVNTQILTDTTDGTLECFSHILVHGNLSTSQDIAAGGNISGAVGYFTTTGAGAAEDGTCNARIALDGRLVKVTGTSSSIRYKNILSHLQNSDIEKLYTLPVYWFKYKDDYIGKDNILYNKEIPGFVVEDWIDIVPTAICYENGKPDSWNPAIVVPLMFQMIKNEHERNDKLQTQIDELKIMIKQLTER